MAEEQRIEIEASGPYRVLGNIPLKEMAPVHTFNGEPVEWHTLQERLVDGDDYELCRCGRTETKPFCDKSHESAPFDGRSSASRRPFLERAKRQVHTGEILADDLALCIDAGFCGTRTTNVWKLFAEDDDPGRREEMKAMVWRCPSGRIALFSEADGSPVEPEVAPEIAVLPGGPLWVRGAIAVVDADGYAWEARNRVTLCRCGASESKPFCDGTHKRLHFDER